MSKNEKDSISVRDRASRRKFIRSGAAFLAAAGTVSGSRVVYGDDCDRAQGAEKSPGQPGSDSDAGENSDPAGCGRQEPPKITRRNRSPGTKTVRSKTAGQTADTFKSVSVKKIIS